MKRDLVNYRQIIKECFELQQQQKDKIEKSKEHINDAIPKITPGTPLVIDMLPGELEYIRVGVVGNFAPVYVAFSNLKETLGDPHKDEFCNVLKQAFTTLGVDPSKHPILMTHVALTPIPSRIAFLDVLLNVFNVKSVALIPNSLLSAIATGQQNCVIIDMNGFVSNIAIIENGQTNRKRIARLDLSAIDMISVLKKNLKKLKITLEGTKSEYIPVLLDLINTQCFAAVDPQKERTNPNLKKTIKFSKDQTITLENERFEVVEPIFTPSLVKKDLIGLTRLTYEMLKSIKREVPSLFEAIGSTIVLVGQYSILSGIKERFFKDLATLMGEEYTKKLNIISSPLNPNLPLIGGLILASSKQFSNISITKSEFEDVKNKYDECQKIFDFWDINLDN